MTNLTPYQPETPMYLVRTIYAEGTDQQAYFYEKGSGKYWGQPMLYTLSGAKSKVDQMKNYKRDNAGFEIVPVYLTWEIHYDPNEHVP